MQVLVEVLATSVKFHREKYGDSQGDFQQETWGFPRANFIDDFFRGDFNSKKPTWRFFGGFVQPPTSLMFSSMSKSFKRIMGCKVGFKGDIVGYKQHLLELGVFQASGPPNNRDTSDCLGLCGPYFEANPYG